MSDQLVVAILTGLGTLGALALLGSRLRAGFTAHRFVLADVAILAGVFEMFSDAMWHVTGWGGWVTLAYVATGATLAGIGALLLTIPPRGGPR